ncbi:hypothetical protein ACCO45_007123 [Purpureocillium lilacinum]|uniref:Uncharacterized protein n=1 Tax=Purpureocillium lilacinum TaxID=33203 RepID=A0ACC4DU57_PURLI
MLSLDDATGNEPATDRALRDKDKGEHVVDRRYELTVISLAVDLGPAVFGKTWENTPLEYRVVAANLGNESVTSAGASDARPLHAVPPENDDSDRVAQSPQSDDVVVCRPRLASTKQLRSAFVRGQTKRRRPWWGHDEVTSKLHSNRRRAPCGQLLKRSRMRTRCLQSIALIIHFIDTEQSQRPSPAPTTEVNLNHQTLKSISIYALASTEPQTIAQ